jgi:putative oxidoreductase
MRALDFHRPKLAYDILRYVLALEFLSHAITRMVTGRVPAFGTFLDGAGFPYGIAWAWGVTLWEVVGGVLLILGWKTPWVAMVFVVQMVFAFFLVHLKFGWFVVGHGANGVEYAVVIAAMCLAAAFIAPRG